LEETANLRGISLVILLRFIWHPRLPGERMGMGPFRCLPYAFQETWVHTTDSRIRSHQYQRVDEWIGL